MKSTAGRAVAWVLGCGLLASSLQAAPDWSEILGPRQGTVPPPAGFQVVWRTELAPALAEAQRENRPLFVTLRCLPCKQCAAFDKEVLEGGPELDPLLRQFVTVRLTDAAALDLRLLPVAEFQDLDLSWWGWILSPQGTVYSVYGGRDHVSDATRISQSSLLRTLRTALAWHYDPRRAGWRVDRSAPDLAGPARTPRDLPGFAAWDSQRPARERQSATCIHCHQVADILRTPAVLAKQFDKERDVQVWPLPENVGLELERDHGLRVRRVMPGSAAAEAGLQSGDVLGAADGQVLFSQADFRGVLHRGPAGAGRVEVVWLRQGRAMSGTLTVPAGWRRTVLDWRMSISQGVIGAGPTFFPLRLPEARRSQLGVHPQGMAVQPYMGQDKTGAAYRAGLRPGHVITAVNGHRADLGGRAFLVWFRQQFEPGDTVTLNLRDEAGLPKVITYVLPGNGE